MRLPKYRYVLLAGFALLIGVQLLRGYFHTREVDAIEAKAPPIAPGTSTSTRPERPEDDPQVQSEARRAIQLAGYRCDEISFLGRLITKTGFRVTCNADRYAYTITDEGGRIVVRLD